MENSIEIPYKTKTRAIVCVCVCVCVCTWSIVSDFLWPHRPEPLELPYDPAIPFLDMYLDKTILQEDTCTSVLIAALFAIAKTWKQPKCPSTDKWAKADVVHIYNGILLSHKK